MIISIFWYLYNDYFRISRGLMGPEAEEEPEEDEETRRRRCMDWIGWLLAWLIDFVNLFYRVGLFGAGVWRFGPHVDSSLSSLRGVRACCSPFSHPLISLFSFPSFLSVHLPNHPHETLRAVTELYNTGKLSEKQKQTYDKLEKKRQKVQNPLCAESFFVFVSALPVSFLPRFAYLCASFQRVSSFSFLFFLLLSLSIRAIPLFLAFLSRICLFSFLLIVFDLLSCLLSFLPFCPACTFGAWDRSDQEEGANASKREEEREHGRFESLSPFVPEDGFYCCFFIFCAYS